MSRNLEKQFEPFLYCDTAIIYLFPFVSPWCLCGSSFLNHIGTRSTKIHKEKSAIIGIVQYRRGQERFEFRFVFRLNMIEAVCTTEMKNVTSSHDRVPHIGDVERLHPPCRSGIFEKRRCTASVAHFRSKQAGL